MNKRNLLIIWTLLISLCAALLFMPSEIIINKETGATDKQVNVKYIDCSPDGVLSGMSMNEVVESRTKDTSWSVTKAPEWESFAFFCETALEYTDYELFGFKGKMTYYFDENDRLSFSCFEVAQDINTPNAFDELTREISDNYGEYSRAGFEGYVDGEHHLEEKRWYVITPNRANMDDMRNWEYISIIFDADCSKLFIYQFGWGIDPMPEGCGLCQTNDLYETFLSRKD